MKLSSNILSVLLVFHGISYDLIDAFRAVLIVRQARPPRLRTGRGTIECYRPLTDNRLHAVAESSELVLPALITIGFAAVAAYTYQNPETSDQIREGWEGLLEAGKTDTTAGNDLSSSSAAELISISPQEELAILMKNVSQTVENQTIKLEELRLQPTKATESPSTTEQKPKRLLIVRLAKKIIAPWRPWSKL
jgi:hypothetical protein